MQGRRKNMTHNEDQNRSIKMDIELTYVYVILANIKIFFTSVFHILKKLKND